MITNIFLNLFYWLLWAITSPLRLLADVSLSSNFSSAITTANTYISAVDYILPTTTLFTIIGLFLSVETFIILFKIINWVIRKIPTIN